MKYFLLFIAIFIAAIGTVLIKNFYNIQNVQNLVRVTGTALSEENLKTFEEIIRNKDFDMEKHFKLFAGYMGTIDGKIQTKEPINLDILPFLEDTILSQKNLKDKFILAAFVQGSLSSEIRLVNLTQVNLLKEAINLARKDNDHKYPWIFEPYHILLNAPAVILSTNKINHKIIFQLIFGRIEEITLFAASALFVRACTKKEHDDEISELLNTYRSINAFTKRLVDYRYGF